MDIFSPWALRLFGFSGIIGSILFMLGDLSYNFVPGSKNSITVKMSGLTEKRLLRAGTLGLVGCWFYLLASFHVYMAFQPAGNPYSFVVLFAFAFVMISYGICHAGYFSIAAGAKVAHKNGSDVESGGKLGSVFFRRLVYITYIPVVASSLMMGYAIVAGKSMYPKWMVVFLPVVIYLLKSPVTGILKGRIKEIINDAYDNLVFFVFFVLSTIVLWN
jgi:hypothetical protein